MCNSTFLMFNMCETRALTWSSWSSGPCLLLTTFHFQLVPWAWCLQPWVMTPPQGQVLSRCRRQPTYTDASFLVFSCKQYLPSLVFRFDYSHYLPYSIFTCNWVNSLASPLWCTIGISKIVYSTLNLSPSPTSPSYFGSCLGGALDYSLLLSPSALLYLMAVSDPSISFILSHLNKSNSLPLTSLHV